VDDSAKHDPDSVAPAELNSVNSLPSLFGSGAPKSPMESTSSSDSSKSSNSADNSVEKSLDNSSRPASKSSSQPADF